MGSKNNFIFSEKSQFYQTNSLREIMLFLPVLLVHFEPDYFSIELSVMPRYEHVLTDSRGESSYYFTSIVR